MEDREVEGESELDGVAGGEGDAHGLLVEIESHLLGLVEFGTLGVLGLIAVVVSDHFDEETLGLTVA